MFNLFVEKPKKLNMIKTMMPLYFIIISVLLLTACGSKGSSETAASADQETVEVKI
jgi:major membrane immunogen (membrane-anchored lipoprotein)